MTDPLFRSLDSAAIASDIRKAEHSVCYAAPGIQQQPANAMAELARLRGPELITVCLDFDERVIQFWHRSPELSMLIRSEPPLCTQRSTQHKLLLWG